MAVTDDLAPVGQRTMNGAPPPRVDQWAQQAPPTQPPPIVPRRPAVIVDPFSDVIERITAKAQAAIRSVQPRPEPEAPPRRARTLADLTDGSYFTRAQNESEQRVTTRRENAIQERRQMAAQPGFRESLGSAVGGRIDEAIEVGKRGLAKQQQLDPRNWYAEAERQLLAEQGIAPRRQVEQRAYELASQAALERTKTEGPLSLRIPTGQDQLGALDPTDPANPLRTKIPYADQVADKGGRAAATVASTLNPVAQEIGERLPYVPTPGGVADALVNVLVPREVWELALELVPGVGSIDEVERLFREGAPEVVRAVKEVMERPEIARKLGRLGSETGGGTPFDPLGDALDPADILKTQQDQAPEAALPDAVVPSAGGEPPSDLPSAAATPDVADAPPPPAEPPTALTAPDDFDGDVMTLTNAIMRSKKLRPAQESAFAAERSRRAGMVAGRLDQATGDEAFQSAQASLRGEFEGHAQFEPPAIPEDRRLRMVEEIRTTDRIRPFEKLNAKQAFDKIMSGRLPEPAELEKLERVFGTDFSEAVLAKTPWSWTKFAVDVLTLPKSLLTTLDLSFPLRQGMVLAPSQPRAWFKSWGPMLRAFAKEDSARAVDEAIRGDALFNRYIDSNGYHSPFKGGATADREEGLVSSLVDKIPGVRNSARAFVTFGNKLRFEAWKSLVSGFDEAPEIDAAFNQFVRHATGRGDVPFKAGEVIPGISAFFSLRNFVSRFQLLADPLTVKNAPLKVRAKITGDIAKFFAAGITSLGLMKLAHDQGMPGFEDVTVEADPRSTDFGKIRVGDRRYDLWAGYQQIARYSAQIMSGQRLAELPDGSMAHVSIDEKAYALKFLESKLDPTLGLAVSLWKGENFIGEPMNMDRKTLVREAWDRAVPFFIRDLAESVAKYGPEGAIYALPGAFGASVQDYETGEAAKQYAMKQVLPEHLDEMGFPSVKRGFESEYWQAQLPSETVKPSDYKSWEDYRTAYVDYWTEQRPEDISEAFARDLAAKKFDSLDAVKEFEKQRAAAELKFWKEHPDLLQQALDANLEDVSKAKLEILEAIPR